jgi:hypothetical protein
VRIKVLVKLLGLCARVLGLGLLLGGLVTMNAQGRVGLLLPRMLLSRMLLTRMLLLPLHARMLLLTLSLMPMHLRRRTQNRVRMLLLLLPRLLLPMMLKLDLQVLLSVRAVHLQHTSVWVVRLQQCAVLLSVRVVHLQQCVGKGRLLSGQARRLQPGWIGRCPSLIKSSQTIHERLI